VIDVDVYEQVRHLYAVEHLSQRAIAKRLGVARNTVKRYCEGHQMPWEPSPRNRTAPATGPVRETVKYWLEADAAAPRKQRHTAQRIHERLTQEGYNLGASTVRRLVRELKAEAAQPYIPLSFDAGEAVQVDWGDGKAYIADTLTTVQLFCIRLCHSCAPFVTAFPNQKEEAFLEGHRCGFEFFGGVPRRAIYDNTKNALSYLTFSRASSELLFQVIYERSERGSVIVTTNLEFSRWTEILGDPMLTAALVDRMIHHAYILNMNGDYAKFYHAVANHVNPLKSVESRRQAARKP